MRYFSYFILLLSVVVTGCGVTDPSPPVSDSDRATADASPTPIPSPTPDEELTKQIETIALDSKGKLGVYAVEIETGRDVSHNADERFAMQSVVKLPISMAVIKMAADGKLRLDSKIAFSKDEIVPGSMRSPMREKYPAGGELSAIEMIKHAMVISDGTAADVLQRVAGGAEGVQAYIDSHGITDMKVRYTHKEFAQEWDRQYENWSTPRAAAQLLRALWSQKASAPQGSDQKELQLLSFMYETPTGPNRLKGMLPKGTPVAHKTGTGSTRDGITSATNDVGIITLPNGNHIAIAVFLRDSSADEKTREAAIAGITKAIWDKWTR